jgi:hypothetical protein
MICGASAISFEKIRKILVVPVCHRHTPAIGYFSKARLLGINESPWPMTLSSQEERNMNESYVQVTRVLRVALSYSDICTYLMHTRYISTISFVYLHLACTLPERHIGEYFVKYRNNNGQS